MLRSKLGPDVNRYDVILPGNPGQAPVLDRAEFMTGAAYHPAFGEVVNWHAIPLSADPDTQVAQTIDMMRRYVQADSGSAPIQQEAQYVAANGSGDPCSDAFWHVKNKVGFQRDEVSSAPWAGNFSGEIVEWLVRPQDLAQMNRPLEDCDGFAQYTPSLLRALGIPCSFVTVAVDPRDPNRYSHVYAACYPPSGRIALDVSHGPYPGWEAPNPYGKKREWPIDGFDWSGLVLVGLGILAWLVLR